MSWISRARWLMLLLCLSVLTASCARRRMTEPLNIRVLVSDFKVADQIEQAPKENKGWWFSSRDIYRNPNNGDIFADILSEQMNKTLSAVDIYSRTDFKFYEASKKTKLQEAYPDLSDEEIDTLFSEISPVDFARDLQLDKVIAGKIEQSYTTHNRAFHWWSSKIKAQIKVLDAESGNVEWESEVEERRFFRSQYATMEKAAKILTKRFKKNYLYRRE